MTTKRWESIFDPSKKVDEANFITEIILSNYLKWQGKPLPRSPFWQKAISENSDVLKDLRKRYAAEVSAVKDLIKVFDFPAVARYAKRTKMVGIRMVKAETKDKILVGLFKENLEYRKEIEQSAVAAEAAKAMEEEAMALPEFIETKNLSITKGDAGRAEL